MPRLPYAFALCLLLPQLLFGVIALDTSTADWTAIEYPTGQSDYLNDQQTGHLPSDLVGDASGNQSAFYKAYSDGGTATLDDDYLGFRVRFAAPDGNQNPTWESNLLIGIDVGADGAADVFIITTQKSGGYIRFYSVVSNEPGQNVSPSTTAVDILNPTNTLPNAADANGYIWERTPDGSFFDYSAVDATTDAFIANGGSGATDNLDGASRNNQIDTDFFLSFQVDMFTLIEAVRLSTGALLDETTSLGFLVGTSIQDNAFNQDLNGQDGDLGDPTKGTLADQTWAQLGAATDAYTASGESPVPESSAYAALLGLLSFSVVVIRRRR